jgi:prephenate dehydratase
MAALAMLGDVDVIPREFSADVFAALTGGDVDMAVLPIENSLHGSVAEHYDLLLANPVRLERESLLRIRHNLIAAPGVKLEEVRFVLSHPVALSQCRRYLAGMGSSVKAMSFYDTAGSVKHIMAEGLRDTAGVAPELAAREYGAQVLVAGIEDHAENYTRFHLVRRSSDPLPEDYARANKMTLAFSVEHRPGTLVGALRDLASAGMDLTRIESRPVPGKPWEYVFYVEFRFASVAAADRAVLDLRRHSSMVKEIGRYVAA